MITLWVDGRDYMIPAEEVIPVMCGISGTLETVDLGERVTVDVDPAIADADPGVTYLVEVDGKSRRLAESWILPWVKGLAIHHGCDADGVCDRTASERAQRVQALMVGHQRGWFTYSGFTHNQRKKETTT